MQASLGFYGAAETVTGSRHLFRVGGKNVLVDCGLFQGARAVRERNWEPFPIDPRDLDAVVLTHAHTDHIGWLPRLVAQGYQGRIYCTKATFGVAKISLPDGGRLQEEEARYVNKKGSSRHKPALPLYTEQDAYASLKHFETRPYHTEFDLPGGMTAQFFYAGHILGSAFVEMVLPGQIRVLMSGDLGRFGTPIIKDPEPMRFADYLVCESTYGNRLHETEDAKERLAHIFADAMRNGTCILIPSFAIGRTQELLYYCRELEQEGRLPRIPIYVDSPMAISATKLYQDAEDEHDPEMEARFRSGVDAMEPSTLRYIRDRDQSKALNAQRGPMVIISGSGMANGGRIRHHLLQRLSQPNTLVLFTGYQAEGTLGRSLIEGAETVRIFGEEVAVRAGVDKLNALSAHADQGEILSWLRGFDQPPKTTFLVHGEPPAQAALRDKIVEELGWNVEIPSQGDVFDLV